jgi:D-2-hydroxyacid dehydrogenase (NADP+)
MIVCLENMSAELIKRIEDQTSEKVIILKEEDDPSELLPQADIIMAFNRIGIDHIKHCKKLKWLYVMSAGVEGIPFDELAQMGVRVTNASGIHVTQMSEYCIGIMIALDRKFHDCMKNQQRRIWDRNMQVTELYGKTLCIVGAGSIGCELARKAKAFDMRVVGIKRHAGPLENFDEVSGMSRFHEYLAQADYVVLLTPLTDETYHLFGAREFSLMKNSAVFINMSRGDTVDEKALTAALKSGEISAAGLDVFHNEPLEHDSELWGFENVMITPHNSGATPEYLDRAVSLFIKSYDCYSRNEALPNLVDLKLKY